MPNPRMRVQFLPAVPMGLSVGTGPSLARKCIRVQFSAAPPLLSSLWRAAAVGIGRAAVRFRSGAPRARGVFGSMLGFQPRGLGSFPGARTDAYTAKFIMFDALIRRSSRSAKPTRRGSTPRRISTLSLRTARALLKRGGLVRHQLGALTRLALLMAQATAFSTQEYRFESGARHSMTLPADPAPGLRSQVRRFNSFQGRYCSRRWIAAPRLRSVVFEFDSRRERRGRVKRHYTLGS